VAGWVVTKPCQLWCGRPVLRRPRRRGPGLRAHHGQRPVPSWNTSASVFQTGTASVTSERQPGRARYLRQRRETSSASTSSVSFMLHAHHPVPVCVHEHVRAVLQYMLDRSGILRSRRPCFSAARRSRRIRMSTALQIWSLPAP